MRNVPMRMRSFQEREKFFRRVMKRKARLSNAVDMSVLFALFSTLASIDLNIEEGDASEGLLLAYVTSMALLVANVVFLKIGTLWTVPSFDTALLMSRFHAAEMDRVPAEDKNLALLWDMLHTMATSGGISLFLIHFILLVWVKFLNRERLASISATIVMAPVLTIALILTFRNIAISLNNRFQFFTKNP